MASQRLILYFLLSRWALARSEAENLSTKTIQPSILSISEMAEISMPLTRGSILGYDNARMAFGFSMLNGAEEVQCQISAAAIDELVGGPRGSYVDRDTSRCCARPLRALHPPSSMPVLSLAAAFS